MKTASVRDLRQDFPRVLAWLEAGEEVDITMRREKIARLIPTRRPKKPARPFPDLRARLKRVFGAKVISDEAVKNLLEQNKGSF